MAAPLGAREESIDALARIVRATSTHRGLIVAGGWWLARGQKRGLVRSDIDPNERAIFLVAAYEGCLSLAKGSQDPRVLQAGKTRIIQHVTRSKRLG